MFSYLCKSCNKETETPQIESIQTTPFGQQVVFRCPSCHQTMIEPIAHCDICGAVIPGMQRYALVRAGLVFCCESCGSVV